MLTALLNQLRGASPEAQIEALDTVAMLEETDALAVLGEMWKAGPSQEIKQAIDLTGQQIHAARKRGYSTIEGLAEAYRIDPNINDKAQKEARLLEQIKSNIEFEQARQHGQSDSTRALTNFSRNTAVSAVVGMRLGTAPLISGAAPTVDTSSDPFDNPLAGTQPLIPPRPADTNINLWIKKLDHADPAIRKQAVMQLRDFNNPVALGPLGKRFANEPEAALKTLIQQVGKQLYFSALFWQDVDAGQTDQRVNEIRAASQAAKQKRDSQV